METETNNTIIVIVAYFPLSDSQLATGFYLSETEPFMILLINPKIC